MRFVVLLLAASSLATCGCRFGPLALEKTHGKYNESFSRVDSEELLLNIVRFRYNDSPAEIEVSAIAAQYELAAQAEGRPFFSTESSGNNIFRTFSTLLPAFGASATSRPTLSLTPIQSGETVARYLSPLAGGDERTAERPVSERSDPEFPAGVQRFPTGDSTLAGDPGSG